MILGDRGILVEPAFLELGYEFADRCVGELDFVDQSRGWRAGGVEIATCFADALLDKLLADAHHLEIHAEDIRHPPRRRAIVTEAIDLVEDGLNLEAVILAKLSVQALLDDTAV